MDTIQQRVKKRTNLQDREPSIIGLRFVERTNLVPFAVGREDSRQTRHVGAVMSKSRRIGVFVARRTEKVEDGCRAFRFARPHAFIHVLKSEVLAGGRFRIPANKADDREHWLDGACLVIGLHGRVIFAARPYRLQ
ncbi:hypothetical protein ATE68_22015 [Sphingopyxis sp. H038]|nr:hypothetical protein ATE78_06040 [Sphingopyxis sp. H012]KTE31342.1 hypothetical protein ATE68_22015 [Sphingopyxis sp. H038]KTE37681.1 hypothetical protein ATE73_21375 [Sphingopyxis sp. H077]KTE60167.1 hypothetical protein ATE74_22430 [Sphingopyxis sp. H085]